MSNRVERVLAYMVASIIVLSLAAFIALIVGTAVGLERDDFAQGIWPTITILPLIGLPIGFVLIIVLLVVSSNPGEVLYREAAEAAGARIVEASDTFGKSLGVRLGGSDQGTTPGAAGPGRNRVAIGGTYGGLAGANGELGTSLDAANTNFVNLPAVGQAGFSASSFAISLSPRKSTTVRMPAFSIVC